MTVEGVYVLELCAGVVKVGRTTNLAGRLRTHCFNAEVAGGQVLQAWSCPVVGGKGAEARILLALASHPTAQRVASSREIFSDVTFLEVVALAREICACYRPTVDDDAEVPEVADGEEVELESAPPILRDVLAVLTGHSADKISSANLVAVLAERFDGYDGFDQVRLADALHPYGIRTKSVKIGDAALRGYDTAGIVAALRRIRDDKWVRELRSGHLKGA